MSQTVTMTETGISALEGSPRHSKHMGDTETVVFSNCKSGLGIKIIGGKSEIEEGRDYGIFIRRIIPRGLAEQSGRLCEGDQILSVNGESLLRVSNEQAVQYLRNASATNNVTMVITRNASATHKFSLLLESQLANTRNTFNLDSQSVSSDQASDSNDGAPRRWSSQRERTSNQSPSPSVVSSSGPGDLSPESANIRVPNAREIVINKLSGLGLSIAGGIDRSDGPSIYIQNVHQDGDCYRDGRLRVGDCLLSVNGESLTGLTNEVAVRILTRESLRSDISTLRLVYIPGGSPMMHHGHPSRQTPSSSYASSPSSNPSPQRYLSEPGNQHPQGLPYTGTSHPLPSRQSPHGGVGLPPSPHMGMSPMNGHDQGNGLVSSQAVNQSTSPPLYGQAMINGYPLSALSQPAPSHIAMPLHLQQRLHIQPALSSTPQTDNINGHHNRVPQPHSTQPEPSPVLPANSITMATQHHGQSASSLATPTIATLSPSPARPRGMSRSRRLSLDPHVRLRVDKLEVALKYLGIDPSEEEKMELRRRLQVDQSGMVPYGVFVAVSRELFKMQLDESVLGAGSLTFAAHDVTDFAEPPPFQQQPQRAGLDTVPNGELETMRRQRDEALREVERLKVQLQEKDRSFNLAEEELLRIRKEAQGAIHESRALKSRVHLAEAAQHEARNIEIDYEEVVHLLEAEVERLQRRSNRTPPQSNPVDIENLQKRLAILSCELRKATISKRTYEVATENLLQFAEVVHEYSSNGPNSMSSGPRGRGESARRGNTGFIPPGYLAKHSKHGPFNLATEAKETVKAVKKLLEVEPLPYGWEEAYTADGMKYFLNHVTQGTTWIHPISNVNHLPNIDENAQELPETRA
ncbi:syntaxin-binding protein 4-like isoform X1 [Asterias rubens]|uniref:syntaxin-binding protein 4-like isoform X1 n=1 Tax=Asterias rubens TaxID=7604 RepID=UPI0014558372|nr:syntaxin-binding protein 4-like isoform X1 [Asterias rubens]